MSDERTVVETLDTVKGKTVVSFTKPTPYWATWMFRIVFLLTAAATIVIAGDSAIQEATKVRIFVYLKGFDVLIWGIARGLGVDKKAFEQE